jgi:hypothetical protein
MAIDKQRIAVVERRANMGKDISKGALFINYLTISMSIGQRDPCQVAVLKARGAETFAPSDGSRPSRWQRPQLR